jgi:hypothetical protein
MAMRPVDPASRITVVRARWRIRQSTCGDEDLSMFFVVPELNRRPQRGLVSTLPLVGSSLGDGDLVCGV